MITKDKMLIKNITNTKDLGDKEKNCVELGKMHMKNRHLMI